MEIGLKTRFSIMELLAGNVAGTFNEMVICKAMANELEITEDDLSTCGITSDGQQVFWRKDLVMNFELTGNRLDFIKKLILQKVAEGILPAVLSENFIDLNMFSPAEFEKIKRLVDDIDAEGKVTNANFEICQKVKNFKRD